MTVKLRHGITKVKDPGNASTHFVVMILAITAATLLLPKAGHNSGRMHISTLTALILSTIGLYTISTTCHTLDTSPKINKLPHRIDHIMILILMAGTYTPICVIVLGDKTGWTMLTLVWGIAIVGILINASWTICSRWFSSLIHVAMDWVRILAIAKILNSMPRVDFVWLLAGGIIYAAGGIIYAMKLPFSNSRHRYSGSYKIFHLFVMGGGLYHYAAICRFVA